MTAADKVAEFGDGAGRRWSEILEGCRGPFPHLIVLVGAGAGEGQRRSCGCGSVSAEQFGRRTASAGIGILQVPDEGFDFSHRQLLGEFPVPAPIGLHGISTPGGMRQPRNMSADSDPGWRARSAACDTLLDAIVRRAALPERDYRASTARPTMKDPMVRGVVHLIEETKSFGQKGFRKRLVVLEQSKGTFTNFIPVEFVKDGCDAVDDLSVGDEIEVTYRLSGRRWQRDESSETKYFLSAEGLSFKRLTGSGRAHDGAAAAIDPNDAFAEAGDDDVPF